MEKFNFVMFCSDCGMPKKIPLNILRDYIPLEGVTEVYCDDCGNANYVGGLVKKYILLIVERELSK